MTALLLAAAAPTLGPGECVITGLCLAAQPAAGPASGVLFLATGLVLLGIWGVVGGRSGRCRTMEVDRGR